MAIRIDSDLLKKLLTFQKDEITEHHVYLKLADRMESGKNREVLQKIAADELRHYEEWRLYTGQDVAPSRWQLWKYYLFSRIFGFTFGVKLMERGEQSARRHYSEVQGLLDKALAIAREEKEHEEALIDLLDEERLKYAGSIVLGLNDALVELTGALAGLTLALQNTRLIALTGLITGIAAALSMGASEYLSTKSEETGKSATKAALYTGAAYLCTVLVLILPYLIFTNYYVCIALTLAAAVMIIAGFNYYISVAQNQPFRTRFLEMAALSFAVAGFSFGIGYLLRSALGVEI
ncbi:MAG TPA: VIT1/CCC1 transporter family protein [Acidobacteriota bacterium]|nr:VIT1/CCC1 transporter family protein [Acidobacteriota bacterium]